MPVRGSVCPSNKITGWNRSRPLIRIVFCVFRRNRYMRQDNSLWNTPHFFSSGSTTSLNSILVLVFSISSHFMRGSRWFPPYLMRLVRFFSSQKLDCELRLDERECHDVRSISFRLAASSFPAAATAGVQPAFQATYLALESIGTKFINHYWRLFFIFCRSLSPSLILR